MFAAFKLIETSINRALSFDARTPQRLEKLEGKSLRVEISDLKLKLTLQFSKKGLHFSNTLLDTQDVLAKGPSAAFLSLAFSKDPFAASRLGLSLEGDMEIAEAIQTLFLSLEIDWEEIVSRLTGDTVAHQLFRLLQKGQNQQKVIWDNLSFALGDYLKEEIRILPSRTEMDEFLNEVDELSLEVERLQARLTQIKDTETNCRNPGPANIGKP